MMDLSSILDRSQGDTLWVISTGYDNGTAFYLNGELAHRIYDNDSYEIPNLLFGYMTKYSFKEVVMVGLSEKGYDLYVKEDFDYEYPPYLSDYNEDHFDWNHQRVYKREVT